MALRTSPLAGLALALSLTTAPGHAQGTPELPGLPPLPGPELLSAPVLTIGETAITWAEYSDWLTRMRGQLLAGQYAGAFRIEQVARERGLSVTEEELEAAVQGEIEERVQNTFAGKRDAWVRAIGRLGRTEEGFLAQRRIEQRHELISWKLAAQDRVVPEEKIVREWERAYGKGGRRFEVRAIKLPFFASNLPGGLAGYERRQQVEQAREELRLEALDLRAGLLAGDDFGEVARKRSGDPDSATNGGVPRSDWNDADWPTSVLDGLGALAPGDLSEPLYARGGYWIFELQGVDVTPLESVQAELEALLIAAGPESDEISTAVDAALEGLDARVEPVLWALPEEGDRVRALDEVVMFIDGLPVRRFEYVRWLDHLQGEIMAPRFVEAWLVDRVARAEAVQIDPDVLKLRVDDDIQRAVDEFFKGQREGWLDRLESRGRDESMWRRELRLRTLVTLRVEELVRRERTIPPALVRNEYDERYGPDERFYDVRVLQLNAELPKQPEDAGGRGRGGRGSDGDDGEGGVEILLEQLMADLETRARTVHAEALAGADFAELCRTHSMDPATAARGGSIEGGFRPLQWPGFVADAVVGLEPGGLAEPQKIGSSVYLFQLVEARDVSFEVEAPKLLKELQERRPGDVDIASYKNVLTRSVSSRVLPKLFE